MSFPAIYLEVVELKPAEMISTGCGRDCKSILNIGIFFDGTDNNFHVDVAHGGHSNVARLYQAYKQDAEKGYFPYYFQGVGTQFKNVGEAEKLTAGAAFGKGGDARVVYALFKVLNSMHSFVNNGKDMYDETTIFNIIAKNGAIMADREKNESKATVGEKIISDIGLTGGLADNPRNRDKLFRYSATALARQLVSKKTIKNISGVYLDVFGFSRGAAQARVFCNWLHESMFSDDKLCGVSAYVRILGLFDTVSSVGYSSSGHSSWATAENLKIHPKIRNCVHYVALHEFRHNFPLDSICVNGLLPPNCREYIGVGCHSDIGGGYEPGEQGKGVVLEPDPENPGTYSVSLQSKENGNKNKLSQLPLNLMLDVARKARANHGEDGDPWRELTDTANKNGLAAQFECNPHLRTAAANYFAKCGVKADLPLEQALCEHNALYLAWRCSVNARKDGFQKLASVKYAQIVDRSRVEFYLQGERFFSEQLEQVRRIAGRHRLDASDEPKFEALNYHRKAGEIYQGVSDRLKKEPVPVDIAVFFDMYVHDSYAGFIGKFKDVTAKGMVHSVAEPKRYLTYRGMYQGDDFNLNAQLRLRDKVVVTA